MTPSLSAVYEEMIERAAAEPFGTEAEAHRRRFFARTGEVAEDSPMLPARLSAAWEDALIGTGLAHVLAAGFTDAAERDVAHLLGRGQRGLFSLEIEGEQVYLADRIGGAAFLLVRGDPLARSARTMEPALLVGRVVAAYDGCTVLPGALWLPSEATSLVPPLLAEAARRGLAKDPLLDALLRMDHAVHTLSRVKPSFAFRISGLPPM